MDREINHRLSWDDTFQTFAAGRLTQVESLSRRDFENAIPGTERLVGRAADRNPFATIGPGDLFSCQTEITNCKGRAWLVRRRLDAQAITEMDRIARNKGQ